ncbi:MAG: D-alanyl-D-alanine carboxypeptidase [Thermoleophilia bacterium]|nr:D-alanyl-D-alanine carboxypeptidase [Thermoleophilia bacterium]
MMRSLPRAAALLLVVLACAATGVALGASSAPRDSSPTDSPLAGDRVGSDIRQLDPPPRVTAKAWLVQDAVTDETVAAVDPSTPRPIASLAKLMTALVALDVVSPTDLIKVPAAVNDLPADAAMMGLRAGETWKAGDLIRAMLVYSANDAALTLASHVGKGDIDVFVADMNARAKELQLDDTNFTSPTGLDVGGVESTSSPLDLVTIARDVYADPLAKSAMSTPKLTLTRPTGGRPIVLTNRNPLIGTYAGVDGVKTGFTDQAGYMLISHDVDAETNGSWFVVTANSSTEKTRASDNAALLDWIRPFRVEALVAEGGEPIASVPVLHSPQRVQVFVCDDLNASVRVGQRLKREVVLPGAVKPPISAGDELGELRVQVGDADARSAQLCSATNVKVKGWRDYLRSGASDADDAWRLGVEEVQHRYRRVTGGKS